MILDGDTYGLTNVYAMAQSTAKEFLDYTDRRFSRLIVLNREADYVAPSGNRRPKWKVQCDCGRTKVVRASHLISGSTTSCGCNGRTYSVKVGETYNGFTVVALPSLKGHGYKTITVQCVCGTLKKVHESSLLNNRHLSCGCSRKYPKEIAAAFMLKRTYKRSADKRAQVFELNDQDWLTLVKGNCIYCGIEPRQRFGVKKNNGMLLYNGVDRLDNSKGYTRENSVSCCGTCNIAKNNLSVEEFMGWVERISGYKYQSKAFLNQKGFEFPIATACAGEKPLVSQSSVVLIPAFRKQTPPSKVA